MLCPPLAEDPRGLITKSNVNSLLPSTYARSPGTKVKVTCYVPASHSLQGPSQVECSESGQWLPRVPTCVSTVSRGPGTGTVTPTKGSGTSNKDTASSDTLSNYSVIIVSIAAILVVLLIVILIIVVCHYCSQRHNAYSEMPKDSAITSTGTCSSSKISYVKMEETFPSVSHDIYKGRDSAPSWHNHPIILMSENYKWRTWSQNCVDRYLRDLDTSRRENLFHSWRDFASISSYRSPSSTTSIV